MIAKTFSCVLSIEEHVPIVLHMFFLFLRQFFAEAKAPN